MHVASLLFRQQRTLEREACALEGCHADAFPLLLRLVRDAMAHLQLEDELSRIVASRTTELWVARNDDAAEHLRIALCELAHAPPAALATATPPTFADAAHELHEALRDQIAYENEELVPCMVRCLTEREMMELGDALGPRAATSDDVSAA